MSSSPSLDGARARVSRAEEHIACVRAEIRSLLKGDEGPRVIVTAGATGMFVSSEDILEGGTLLSILIGEAVFNLRSALEYVVYEASILHSGHVTEGTQFPIESKSKLWPQRKATWLRALSARQQDIIERMQPFSGCSWTETLRDLSNVDKHRKLLTTTRSISASVSGGAHGNAFFIPGSPGTPTTVNVTVTKRVIFADGKAVAETLEDLVVRVSGVIEDFEPDFR